MMTLTTMTQAYRTRGRCLDCGAEVLYGTPLHVMRVQAGKKRWIELRCIPCAEGFALDNWPDTYGPCPYSNRVEAGRC